MSGLGHGMAQSIYPAGLATALAYQLLVLHDGDGVRLQMFANDVRENQVGTLPFTAEAGAAFAPTPVVETATWFAALL